VTETVERHVGQSVRRREDTALTTGRGTWTDGIAVPGTLHLAVLRSPVAQIGESGAIGSSPAVVNAVIDAIAHLGVTHVDMPVTPEEGVASDPGRDGAHCLKEPPREEPEPWSTSTATWARRSASTAAATTTA
jgi:hypothetical protein